MSAERITTISDADAVSKSVKQVTTDLLDLDPTAIVEAINQNFALNGVNPEDIPSSVDMFLDRLARASKAQQITAGGVSGWTLGFLFNKFGKPVLYLVGSSIIIGLFAERQGYLRIDWDKVRSDYAVGRRRIEQHINSPGTFARRNGRPWLEKVKVMARSSPYLSGGFLGGILLGLAS